MESDKAMYDRYSFPVTLDIHPAQGLNIVALNTALINTSNIDYHEEGYDVLLTFFYTGTKWIFTLENKDESVNVNKIAQVYQGSGTQNKATFTAKFISEVFNNKIH